MIEKKMSTPIADNSAEQHLLSALLIRNGECVPAVTAILSADDFYSPKNRVAFRTIVNLYGKGSPPNLISIMDELRKTGELEKVGVEYIFSLDQWASTNAYAESHAKIIKEKSNLRRAKSAAEKVIQDAEKGIMPVADILSAATSEFNAINSTTDVSKISTFGDYFNHHIISALDESSKYGNRKTGFSNIDSAQFFSPGLYVLGATPAAGKTTFAWQLLEQLAKSGEQCIFCSYEMSALELYCKSVARELLNRYPDVDPFTLYSAAKIRRTSISNLPQSVIDVMSDFADSTLPLRVIELRNENVDALLNLLRPMCKDKEKAPVVCIDYLQIIPSDKDVTKLGVDDTVRKLKAFQRDTNTTFIVVSSFNRANYLLPVSFESFKESGGIEYTADVVWGLQLHIMNQFNSSMVQTKARKMVDDAKKEVPREIQLKCLKNRQGANYDCYFRYFAANDCFVECTEKDFNSGKNKKPSGTSSNSDNDNI